MYGYIKALSKRAVKLDRAFEVMNQKCIIKGKRMIRKAISLEKELIKAMSKIMPLADKAEVKDMTRKQLVWMEERINARRGRITQFDISRTERRLAR